MKKRFISFTFRTGCIVVLTLYLVGVIGIYAIAGDQFYWKKSEHQISNLVSTRGAEPLFDDHMLQQTFLVKSDQIRSVKFKTCTYGRVNRGMLKAQLVSVDNGSIYAETQFDMSQLPDNEFVELQIAEPLNDVYNKKLALKLTGQTDKKEYAASVVYNETISLPEGKLLYDNTPLSGGLCLQLDQFDTLWFGSHYFAVTGVLGLLLALYLWFLCYCRRVGRRSIGLNLIEAFIRYRFLLKQLIARDFKAKYKRSVLGVFWSFLNPLLTMTVQYIVFSTVFKNDIENFPVYLLIGIVFFNFFSEACGMGLMSIVGNASLITKVYIPKYIFPVSRVCSSAINFGLAFIPLFLATLITKQPITKAFLLIPFSWICMLVFCIGMTLLLSATMVFFRDIQFLWNVISILWMYATPIFYPESIIPAQFMSLYKMNPLYHFIRFTRIAILEGVSPEPKAYLLCIVAAVVPLCLGLILFKKTQDRFVLNI